MDLYEASVPQFEKMLRNVERWLDKAVAHADRKKFDPALLLRARLAPDQYELSRQVGAACDTAKFTCARLTGREAPRHPDTEITLEEVRGRVRSVLGYLDDFGPEDFVGAAARAVAPPPLPGKVLSGWDYLFEMQVPNFYFHVTTAYAILRHNGVELGKLDFLGQLRTRPQ